MGLVGAISHGVFGPSFAMGLVVSGRMGQALSRKEREVGLYERLLEEREREEATRNDPEPAWWRRPSVSSYVPGKEWAMRLGPGPYGYVTKQEIAEELAEHRCRYRREVAQLAGFVERGGPSGLASAYLYHHLKRKHPYAYDRLMSEKWSSSTAEPDRRQP